MTKGIRDFPKGLRLYRQASQSFQLEQGIERDLANLNGEANKMTQVNSILVGLDFW